MFVRHMLFCYMFVCYVCRSHVCLSHVYLSPEHPNSGGADIVAQLKVENGANSKVRVSAEIWRLRVGCRLSARANV